MARLQILYLPDIGTPDRRFGLVVDQLDEPFTDDEHADLDHFREAIGAAGMYTTTRVVDCAQGEDVEWPEEFAGQLREMVDARLAGHVQAAQIHQADMTAQQRLGRLGLLKPDGVPRTWGAPAPDPREGIPGWAAKVGDSGE